MDEQVYKIVLTGSLEAVEGCESLTFEQCNEWLKENQVIFEVANEIGDLNKYIVIPLSE